MKILIINSVCGIGSTGRIVGDAAIELEKQGYEVRIAYGRFSTVPDKYRKYAVRIGGRLQVCFHALLSRMTDRAGFYSRLSTKRFLQWADSFCPDVLWLNNIHGYYINAPLLFRWIKKRTNLRVFWTLHDCWPFTGHCTYFSFSHCDQWLTGCQDCKARKDYPMAFFSSSKRNFLEKKDLFSGIKNLTIIVPSDWLGSLVRRSFLRDYPVVTVRNKIDKSIFYRRDSSFRDDYGLSGKIVCLSVANIWNRRKGLGDLLTLARLLDDSFAIVIVGLTIKQIRSLQKRQDFSLIGRVNGCFVLKASGKKSSDVSVSFDSVLENDKGIVLPQNPLAFFQYLTKDKTIKKGEGAKLLCIPKTESVDKLAEIYSGSDFFVNPTLEENYPTVNLEAIACGTFVLTYDTGGCKETLLPTESDVTMCSLLTNAESCQESI